MNQETLNNLEAQVGAEQLYAKGYKKYNGIMMKVWRDYEIRYIEIRNGLYALDRILHLRNKVIGEDDKWDGGDA